MQLTPVFGAIGADVVGASLLGEVTDPLARQWARQQMNLTSLPIAMQAVQAVSDFTSHQWIGTVSVPIAVVITTEDQIVPVSRQRRLAQAIPDALVHELAGGHGVFLDAPNRFATTILAACRAVTRSEPVSPSYHLTGTGEPPTPVARG